MLDLNPWPRPEVDLKQIDFPLARRLQDWIEQGQAYFARLRKPSRKAPRRRSR
jgi:hypothetical protein